MNIYRFEAPHPEKGGSRHIGQNFVSLDSALLEALTYATWIAWFKASADERWQPVLMEREESGHSLDWTPIPTDDARLAAYFDQPDTDEIGAAMRAKDRIRKRREPRTAPAGVDPRWYFTDVPGEIRIACVTDGAEYLCPGCSRAHGWTPGTQSAATWCHYQALAPDQNPAKGCDRCGTTLLREGD